MQFAQERDDVGTGGCAGVVTPAGARVTQHTQIGGDNAIPGARELWRKESELLAEVTDSGNQDDELAVRRPIVVVGELDGRTRRSLSEKPSARRIAHARGRRPLYV